MAYFSNGTEGIEYQEAFCFKCAHWNDDYGCPVWFHHEFHQGDRGWQTTLDRLIPRKKIQNLTCSTYRERTYPREAPLTPGQQAGLHDYTEWLESKSTGGGERGAASGCTNACEYSSCPNCAYNV